MFLLHYNSFCLKHLLFILFFVAVLCLDEDEWEDVEEEALPVTSCLFCPQTSETLPDNVDHMTKEHSFFIPNIEFLIDPQSMFEYLGRLEIFFFFNSSILKK